ncbi:Hypothetical protein FNO222_0909 [Francisella orientalis]|uniref:Uncharacterized protein n=1 Tax=Francisella orientalis TaxID=299583 RepID=A0ABM5U6A6_9GAMM|nr:hypothetical protein FNO12_0901 [Francisella orientalis FNO12]AKN87117.1 Hypothetical protein FNO24_0903 [Francisella orientalis FNO24]AKN88654.1 Hypothetical protein FNO190_0901 [Francisella orientalis]AKU05411.1 Hypothetical protein FNO01_0901 [Francisella orientalis]QEN20324.1 Hypothetical protein FNO39_0909 [Francisella orientalis]
MNPALYLTITIYLKSYFLTRIAIQLQVVIELTIFAISYIFESCL